MVGGFLLSIYSKKPHGPAKNIWFITIKLPKL